MLSIDNLLMRDTAPTFPPLLNGHPLPQDAEPFSHACEKAAASELSAGDLVWSSETKRLRFALVLEPDVPRRRCGEMLYAAMVAFGDATGALVPPEIAITYQWPNVILMNDGRIGSADLALSAEADVEIPHWMVLGLDVCLKSDAADWNPGENYHETTFWEEGCGDITCVQLMESVSRHLVNAIHTWTEDGFRPIQEQWTGRLNKHDPLAQGFCGENARFIGVDEQGMGLLSISDETVLCDVPEILNERRGAHASKANDSGMTESGS